MWPEALGAELGLILPLLLFTTAGNGASVGLHRTPPALGCLGPCKPGMPQGAPAGGQLLRRSHPEGTESHLSGESCFIKNK